MVCFANNNILENVKKYLDYFIRKIFIFKKYYLVIRKIDQTYQSMRRA